VSKDWFKNGKFISETKVRELSILQWDVKGLQSNLYEATKDVGIPVRINQVPISNMSFDISSYSEIFDNNVFDLPQK
jgi:hypothetical protein